MIAIKRGKEICYLLQNADTDSSEIAEKKEHLIKQGYLVVTMIEGKEHMEKALRELVKNRRTIL